MRVIRASEIATYQFCNRAWWYQIQGYEPENQVELARGTQAHARHYYKVTGAGCLQTIAYIAVLLAILAAIVWILQSTL